MGNQINVQKWIKKDHLLEGEFGDGLLKVWITASSDGQEHIQIMIKNPDGAMFNGSLPLKWIKPIVYDPSKGGLQE